MAAPTKAKMDSARLVPCRVNAMPKIPTMAMTHAMLSGPETQPRITKDNRLMTFRANAKTCTVRAANKLSIRFDDRYTTTTAAERHGAMEARLISAPSVRQGTGRKSFSYCSHTAWNASRRSVFSLAFIELTQSYGNYINSGS